MAAAVATWNINQPQGIVTETMLIAVAENAAEDRHTVAYIKPTSFKIIADSITQKDLNTQNKVDAELWTNGFCPPQLRALVFRGSRRQHPSHVFGRVQPAAREQHPVRVHV